MASEVIPCPSCGHENTLLATVCERCGVSLFGVAPAPHVDAPSPRVEAPAPPVPAPAAEPAQATPPPAASPPAPAAPMPFTMDLPLASELALVHSTGARLAAPGDRLEVGRDGDLRPDFFLTFPAVSRRHLTLRRHGSGIWTVTDHSRHGTRLNGEPLPSGEARPLRDGDTLKIADQTFTVSIR